MDGVDNMLASIEALAAQCRAEKRRNGGLSKKQRAQIAKVDRQLTQLLKTVERDEYENQAWKKNDRDKGRRTWVN